MTARQVASSFFKRAISRASVALTVFSSLSSCSVLSCSCVSCAMIESLLICVFISLYWSAKRWYSFSISFLSSSASSCISRLACCCCLRFNDRYTTPPVNNRQTTTNGMITFLFMIANNVFCSNYISKWFICSFMACKNRCFCSKSPIKRLIILFININFCNFTDFLNNIKKLFLYLQCVLTMNNLLKPYHTCREQER